ncbi:Uncharacterised protein [uncultured archaeon]|nr:Uncharacterised protein [uncultured archaeon]
MVNGKEESSVKYPKIYVITAAQAAEFESVGEDDKKEQIPTGKGEPNRAVLASLEKYCEKRGAELIILPMAGKNAGETELHPELASRKDILWKRKKKLNSNIYVSDMVVPPQNVDCTTGRGRFVARDQTLIMAHSKQRMKAFPNSNFDLPKILLGTGAITLPNYNETNHRGDAAKRDHAYGAFIVEVVDDRLFHFRNVRALANGKFIDMGLEFNKGSKQKKAGLEALVPVDLHIADTDPLVRHANYEMIEEFGPKRLVLHDLFNGHSVNHHDWGKLVTLVRDVYLEGRADLTIELKQCYEELCSLAKAMKGKEVIVVASNHNEFLDKYLEAVRLKDDPLNAYMASQLMAKMMEGEDPVEAGLRKIGKIPKNVTFLKRDEDYKVLGWQLGSHGDRGMAGGRGSMVAREFANGKSITGHSHVPEILRDTYVVGTSTYLNLPYTKGSPSAWMNSDAMLWDNGTAQLVNIIYGKWRMNEKIIIPDEKYLV